MKYISHRGNLTGRNPDRENSPAYIEEAISAGYDVEIDVWYIDGEFYLGHDEPRYGVCLDWLLKHPLWCHAKNLDALERMTSFGVHCFWHENDRFTLTSKSIPWCFPNNWSSKGITVVFDAPCSEILSKSVLGICTDDPVSWKKFNDTKNNLEI